MNVEVLLITDKDFTYIKAYEILRFLVSGFPPLHRYKALLSLTPDQLILREVQSNYRQFITITKEEIIQVYLGFDSNYRFYYTRGLGIRWQPVRLQIKNQEFGFLYLIFRDKFWGDSNKIWFESLKQWLK